MKKQRHNYNRIKAYLALKHTTNKQLAEHLGVSQQTVSKWCTNYSQPSIPELYNVAIFLNVDVVELLEPMQNITVK